MVINFDLQSQLQDIEYIKFTDINTWSTYVNTNETKIQIVHINICSIRKHFNQLKVLLHKTLNHLDVLCLTEINIRQDQVAMYTIDGFNMFSQTREKKRGGGILVYVKNNVQYSPLQNYNASTFELIHGHLVKNVYKAYLLVIYRPPHTNKSIFTKEVENIIRPLAMNTDIILVGDCNINLLESALDSSANKYLNTLADLGLHCGIQDITREAVVGQKRVASCIDHVFMRNVSGGASAALAYTLTSQVADHYLTGISAVIDKERGITCVSKTRYNNKAIRDKLNNVDWSPLLQIQDPNVLYTKMFEIFGDIYNSSKINNSVCPKRKTQSWVTDKLRMLIEEKDMLFRQWKSDPKNNNKRLLYTRCRNKTQKLINMAKNKSRHEAIINCKGDMRKIWSNINSWLGRSKVGVDSVIEKYLLKNETLQSICNNFCETFTREIDLIKHKCKHNFLDRTSYVNYCNLSFRFKKVLPKDVKSVIEKLDCNKSPGSDGIRVKDLKQIKEQISPIIAYFINISVKNSQYPEELKKSIVRPIYKQGSHQDYSNYRPIAILNTVNKIFEKIIVKQLTNFLEKNNILNEVQHGFRINRSTATALEKFTDEVNNRLNEKKIVMVIFIDFKKAFDTLDHSGLLQAMNECGIRGPMNAWFSKYLDQRSLKVCISGTESVRGDIKFGVPTGSVYGPLGYIMHVNSMSNVLRKCKAFMYADDTCLVYSHNNIDVIQQDIQNDFDRIVQWAHDNGIIINTDKTKCMLIHSPYHRNKSNLMTVGVKGHSYECLHNNKLNCLCSYLETVTSYKYLGLVIDNTFTWNLHVNNVCNKLRAILGKLKSLKHAVNRKLLFTLYYALADSVIEYGLGGYGLTFPTHLNKIKILQIRLLKLLADKKTKKSLNKNYEKLFKICKILPVHNKSKLNILTEQFNNEYYKEERRHMYPTRLSKKKTLVVPKVTNYFGKRTRKYVVPSLVNELPPHLISHVKSKQQLKNVLKKHYLSLCP